jgi:hypothetical protein
MSSEEFNHTGKLNHTNQLLNLAFLAFWGVKQKLLLAIFTLNRI